MAFTQLHEHAQSGKPQAALRRSPGCVDPDFLRLLAKTRRINIALVNRHHGNAPFNHLQSLSGGSALKQLYEKKPRNTNAFAQRLSFSAPAFTICGPEGENIITSEVMLPLFRVDG
jgi:hypothetical protein